MEANGSAAKLLRRYIVILSLQNLVKAHQWPNKLLAFQKQIGGVPIGTSPYLEKTMKKRDFKWLIMGSLVILFGCKERNTANDFLPEMDAEAIKVYIDPDEQATINLQDIIDTVRYIALETSDAVSIGSINILRFDEDKIFVGDIDNTQSIYCFNDSGKFIFKIQNQGKGPGEYVSMNDFDLDRDSKFVLVHDAPSKAVLKYDFSGNFISRHVNGYLFDSFRHIKENTVIAYSKYIANPGIKNFPNSSIFTFNYKTGKVEKSLLTFDDDLSLFMKIQGLINYTSSSGAVAYIYDYYNNTIYSYEEETFSKRWEFTFGRRDIPDDFWINANFQTHKEEIRKGSICGGLINFQIAGNWILGYYPYKSKSNTLLYNRATNSVGTVSELIANSQTGFPVIFLPPYYSDGESIISVIEPV